MCRLGPVRRAHSDAVVARVGWFLLLVVVVGTDVIAAMNNRDSLTSTFRRAVAETPSLRKYDPLDRLYYRLNPAGGAPPDEGASPEP
jgi:hypothetical protein